LILQVSVGIVFIFFELPIINIVCFS